MSLRLAVSISCGFPMKTDERAEATVFFPVNFFFTLCVCARYELLCYKVLETVARIRWLCIHTAWTIIGTTIADCWPDVSIIMWLNLSLSAFSGIILTASILCFSDFAFYSKKEENGEKKKILYQITRVLGALSKASVLAMMMKERVYLTQWLRSKTLNIQQFSGSRSVFQLNFTVWPEQQRHFRSVWFRHIYPTQ